MPRSKQYSDEQLLDDLRRAASSCERPLTQEKYYEHGSHSTSTIQRAFGSWNSAKEKAGLEAVVNGGHTSVSADEKERRLRVIKDESPCTSCGSNPTWPAMDFHHVHPPQKYMGVTKMVRRHKSWEDIANEMEKCALVCANCHREIEYGERVV
jgi:hypothetical protein